MKKRILEKVAAVVLTMAMAAGGLTGCAYIPQISGTDSASGAAVSEQKDNRVTKESDSESVKKTKGLKFDEKGKYSGWIDLNYQSSKYFYNALCDETDVSYIYQISPDGKTKKKTGIKSKKYISLISVDSEWVYYGMGNKIYRVPIVSQNDSEILDKEKSECLVKKCSGAYGALVEKQKLYYLTESNVTVSKKIVKEDVQIHCLDLVTGEERVCPDKIVDTEAYSYYKEYGELDFDPSFYITEHYIYYMDFMPNYLYQLDKDTLELTVIDELDSGDSDHSEYSFEITSDGAYIWYIKVSAENKKCEYELCQYDVKKQVKHVICTGKEFLDFLCQEEKVRIKDVDWVNIENILHCDGDKIYIEYDLTLKEKKNVTEYKRAVMVYSMSTGKLETLSELCNFYQKYTYEGEDVDDETYRDSSVEVEGYLRKENKFLLSIYKGARNYKEGESLFWYAVYDIDTKKIKKISDKKAIQLTEEIEEADWQDMLTARY